MNKAFIHSHHGSIFYITQYSRSRARVVHNLTGHQIKILYS